MLKIDETFHTGRINAMLFLVIESKVFNIVLGFISPTFQMISLAILNIWPVIVLHGLGTELQNTGSWVRHWTTDHWVVC